MAASDPDVGGAGAISKILEALAVLQEDVNKLKAAQQGVSVRDRVSPEPGPSFTGFGAGQDSGEGHALSASPPPRPELHLNESAEEGEITDEAPTGSILLQAAKSFGPVAECTEDLEEPVAAMVNHLFAHGMPEEDYKDVLDADVTKRPNHCPALTPVECNTQVLDALSTEAKKSDYRLKEVGKNITKAATILVKSLSVLDKLALEQENPVIGREVAMLNGALALLGNANLRTNLARRHIIKREINHKYSHLCNDKAPMTSLLFGDNLSQAAKQIEIG